MEKEEMVKIPFETPVNHLKLVNSTGETLVKGDFAVVAGYAGVADEAETADGAVGSFAIAEGLQVATTNLKSGQNTFGTQGQDVFWDKTSKKFSDTTDNTYSKVGVLVEVKDSGGRIVFDKFRRAVPVA